MIDLVNTLRLQVIKAEILSRAFTSFSIEVDFGGLEDALPPQGMLEYCERETLTPEEISIFYEWDEPINTDLKNELEKLKEIQRIHNTLTDDSDFYQFFPTHIDVNIGKSHSKNAEELVRELIQSIEEANEDKITEGISLLKEQKDLYNSIDEDFWSKLNSVLEKLEDENDGKMHEFNADPLFPVFDEGYPSPLIMDERWSRFIHTSIIDHCQLSEHEVSDLNNYFEGLCTRISHSYH